MSEARLWGYIRAQSDIQNNMSRVLDGNESGLLGYFRLNGNLADRTGRTSGLVPTGSISFVPDVPF